MAAPYRPSHQPRESSVNKNYDGLSRAVMATDVMRITSSGHASKVHVIALVPGHGSSQGAIFEIDVALVRSLHWDKTRETSSATLFQRIFVAMAALLGFLVGSLTGLYGREKVRLWQLLSYQLALSSPLRLAASGQKTSV